MRRDNSKLIRVAQIGACAGLNLLASAGIVLAQSTIQPPERPTLDQNNVDVQSDEAQFSQKLMSIGPDGPMGLNYSISISFSAGIRNSFSTLNIDESGDMVSPTESVSTGEASESFADYVSNQGDGAYLDSDGYYYGRDGTSIAFNHLLAESVDPVTGSTTLYRYASSITYPNGVALTFHYLDVVDSAMFLNVRLQSVTSNTGYQMKFYYQSNTVTPTTRGPWGAISSVVAINNAVVFCDPDANGCTSSSTYPTGTWPQVTYSSPSGYSFAVADPNGNQTSIAYGFPTFSIKSADSSSNNIVYQTASVYDGCQQAALNKVSTATINGRVTNYSYSTTPFTETVVSSAPLSQQYTYASNIFTGGTGLCRTGVNQVTDPLGRVTSFVTDFYGRLTKATFPELDYISYVLDGRGNKTQITQTPKPSSGSPTLSESFAFPVCSGAGDKVCNQPSTHTDPRGNVTTFTYGASHGGVLTEVDPPDASGIKPEKRYTYASRYAWILNSSGTYVHAPSPIWLRTEERTCMKTATIADSSCAGGSSDEIVTSYDYGPDSGPSNLLIHGKVVTSNGVSLRTCYGYDQYGNKISETSPRAGLTSCP